MQIAEVCANDYTFLSLCSRIACPPTENDCSPNAIVNDQIVDVQMGCQIPFDANPYAKSSATRSASSAAVNAMTSLAVTATAAAGIALMMAP